MTLFIANRQQLHLHDCFHLSWIAGADGNFHWSRWYNFKRGLSLESQIQLKIVDVRHPDRLMIATRTFIPLLWVSCALSSECYVMLLKPQSHLQFFLIHSRLWLLQTILADTASPITPNYWDAQIVNEGDKCNLSPTSSFDWTKLSLSFLTKLAMNVPERYLQTNDQSVLTRAGHGT